MKRKTVNCKTDSIKLNLSGNFLLSLSLSLSARLYYQWQQTQQQRNLNNCHKHFMVLCDRFFSVLFFFRVFCLAQSHFHEIQYSFSSDKSTVVCCFRYFSTFAPKSRTHCPHWNGNGRCFPPTQDNSISVRSTFAVCFYYLLEHKCPPIGASFCCPIYVTGSGLTLSIVCIFFLC